MRKEIDLRQLYEILENMMGPQGWWPAENFEEMLTSMVLIQNTNSKNVFKSLQNLKKRTDMKLDNILALSDDELKELIQPSGFFNSKAIYIRSLLTAYRDDFDDWSKLPTPELRKKLLALKGIGNETADVIMIYYFHRSTFVADNYAMRLFMTLRVYDKKPKYLELKNKVEENFDFSPDDAAEFHAVIDEFGKLKSDYFKDYKLKI